MIIKFGPTVVGARGTIAGTTFSANKSGPYAKAWSKGANPKSAEQTEQRGGFGSLASSWRDLTQAQRDDWIDYAGDPAQEKTNSLGENFFASGFNWYIEINEALEAAEEARRVDAPIFIRPPPPILQPAVETFFVTGAAVDTHVFLATGSPGLGVNLVIFALVTGQGRTAISGNLTAMKIAIPSAGRKVFYQDEIEAAFGTIILGQREFFHVQVQDSQGQRSPLVANFDDANS